MKNSLLILGDPAQQGAAAGALTAAAAAVSAGEDLVCAFFYSDAVRVARDGLHPTLAAEWARLAAESDCALIACSSSAVRRGVLDAREAAPLDQTPTLTAGFQLAGLGQLAEAILESDRLLIFGRQHACGSEDTAGDRQLGGDAPLVIITHDGSDPEITKESLDLAMALAAFLPETALLFQEAGASLLRDGTPEPPHRNALRAMQEYGLEAVYVNQDDLSAQELSAGGLCIPCRIVDDAACQELSRRHGPVITL